MPCKQGTDRKQVEGQGEVQPEAKTKRTKLVWEGQGKGGLGQAETWVPGLSLSLEWRRKTNHYSDILA